MTIAEVAAIWYAGWLNYTKIIIQKIFIIVAIFY